MYILYVNIFFTGGSFINFKLGNIFAKIVETFTSYHRCAAAKLHDNGGTSFLYYSIYHRKEIHTYLVCYINCISKMPND